MEIRMTDIANTWNAVDPDIDRTRIGPSGAENTPPWTADCLDPIIFRIDVEIVAHSRHVNAYVRPLWCSEGHECVDPACSVQPSIVLDNLSALVEEAAA